MSTSHETSMDTFNPFASLVPTPHGVRYPRILEKLLIGERRFQADGKEGEIHLNNPSHRLRERYYLEYLLRNNPFGESTTREDYRYYLLSNVERALKFKPYGTNLPADDVERRK
jgi:hypothetical protein